MDNKMSTSWRLKCTNMKKAHNESILCRNDMRENSETQSKEHIASEIPTFWLYHVGNSLTTQGVKSRNKVVTCREAPKGFEEKLRYRKTYNRQLKKYSRYGFNYLMRLESLRNKFCRCTHHFEHFLQISWQKSAVKGEMTTRVVSTDAIGWAKL